MATDDHVSDAIDGTPEPADSRGYVWEATGGPILLSVDPRTLWRRLSTTAGLRDTVDPDAGLEAKVAGRAALMGRWLVGFADRRDLLAALDTAGIAWGDVRDATTLFDSPTLRHGEVVTQVDDHAGSTRGVVRMPYRFSVSTSEVRARPRSAASTTATSSPTGSAPAIPRSTASSPTTPSRPADERSPALCHRTGRRRPVR